MIDSQQPGDDIVFYFPVEGLRISSAIKIGAGSFIPGGDAPNKIPSLDPGLDKLKHHHERHGRFLENLAAGSYYEVSANSRDEAFSLSDNAIHLLRLYYHYQGRMGATHPAFGLPGQTSTANTWYLRRTAEHVTPGWHRDGHVLGVEIPEKILEEFRSSKAFAFASNAIATLTPSQGAQSKAAVGIELMSQALIGLNHSVNVMHWVQALEAMITDRSTSAQTFHFARRGAFFGCGRLNDSLCGRDRNICRALKQDPADNRQRTILKNLINGTDTTERLCSEWSQLMDWYDARSDYAHGGLMRDPSTGVARDAAKLDLDIRTWILNFYMVPILIWLSEHAMHPVADLDHTLASLAGTASGADS
ncbi:hypothetical protein ACX801_12405 [Arthrobacter bambusae]